MLNETESLHLYRFYSHSTCYTLMALLYNKLVHTRLTNCVHIKFNFWYQTTPIIHSLWVPTSRHSEVECARPRWQHSCPGNRFKPSLCSHQPFKRLSLGQKGLTYLFNYLTLKFLLFHSLVISSRPQTRLAPSFSAAFIQISSSRFRRHIFALTWS